MSPATYIYLDIFIEILQNILGTIMSAVSILVVVESSSHQARLMSFVLLSDTTYSIIQEFSINK